MGTTKREWKGCVAADRKGRLFIKIKIEGKWRYRAVHLDDTPENRVKAEGILAEVRNGLICPCGATGTRARAGRQSRR